MSIAPGLELSYNTRCAFCGLHSFQHADGCPEQEPECLNKNRYGRGCEQLGDPAFSGYCGKQCEMDHAYNQHLE